eukprot:3071040-Alexandrium_andersonii.AAC.1
MARRPESPPEKGEARRWRTCGKARARTCERADERARDEVAVPGTELHDTDVQPSWLADPANLT